MNSMKDERPESEKERFKTQSKIESINSMTNQNFNCNSVSRKRKIETQSKIELINSMTNQNFKIIIQFLIFFTIFGRIKINPPSIPKQRK